MPFTFTDGLTPAPKRQRVSKRKVASRISAPCQCYEMGMTCPHSVKERTTTLGDSTSIAVHGSEIPDWRLHFEMRPGMKRHVSYKVNDSGPTCHDTQNDDRSARYAKLVARSPD